MTPRPSTGALADRDAWRADRCPIVRRPGRGRHPLGHADHARGLLRHHPFDDFAERVGITDAVAAARLRELVDAGLLRRRPYQEPGQRTRHEYRLTESGRDLLPVVVALFEWGARHVSPGGRAPVELSHADCGAPVRAEVRCAAGHDVPLGELEVSPRSRRGA